MGDQSLTNYLKWRVVVSSAGVYLRSYDETDQLIISHNGGKKWAENQIKRLVIKANEIARGINGTRLDSLACPAPTAKTEHYAARLKEIEPTFLNVLDAGTMKIEQPEPECRFFDGV